MHTISLPYGNGHLTLSVPQPDALKVIKYRSDTGMRNGQQVISDALANPIGTEPLHRLCSGRKRIAILISDMTRLAPTAFFLPYLLKELSEGGIQPDQIRIIVALGTHRLHTRSELQQLVGENVYNRYTVENHSALSEDCVDLGITSIGTPVELNRTVVDSDLVIATGCIEPHRLAGISGGVKALFPGVASAKSIQHNHSLFMTNKTEPGNMHNRIHEDFVEVLQMKRIDFLFNVIVNHQREVMDAVAGDCVEAHRVGAEMARNRFIVPVSRTYPFVLVTPGGAPKDLHLYQSLKAIQNAADLTMPGGTILCAAECIEHYGSGNLQNVADSSKDLDHMVRRIQDKFIIGAHKAVTLQQLTRQYNVRLYSKMPSSLVERVGLIPIAALQDELDECFSKYGMDGAYMPFGSITFPMVGHH